MPLRPPMTGWNTRDDLDGMDETDAVVMDNFYADAGGLITRTGTLPYATGLAGPVQTLCEYHTGTTRKLIACGGGSVYDVSGGTVATLGSGFANSQWIATNFSGSLFLANGSDPVQKLTGAALTSAAFTGPATPPIGVFTYKGRLFFWLASSPTFWYAPTGNITGALASFNLSTIAQFGGNILCLTNFSHDGGDGISNTFAIIMTTGEVLLYAGSDPSLTSDWQIIGKYKLAAPIGSRSVAPYGGDVYLSTLDDHVALQEQLAALKVGQTPPRSKITGAVKAAMIANPNGYGYQALYYGKGRRVVFNIPNIDGTYDQHLYNTSNQSWQRWRGRNGSCWSEFKTGLYFGRDDGSVWQADVGYTDNGMPITCVAQQAWTSFSIATQKRLAGTRPILQLIPGQRYAFKVGFDYEPLAISIAPSPTPSALPYWDVTYWNTTLWAPEAIRTELVHAASGTGTVISVALAVATVTPVVWMRTDLIVEVSKQI
ncbi:MAG TPA: hypothetical protein VH184_13875 [Dongiaceae bacterium]|nr:hypothetical protein [Dongiaceae bacterium]